MPTPYLIGTNTPGAAASQVITVATGTGTGDCIIVALGNTSSAGATVSSVTDSKSNTYTRIGTANTSNEFGDWFISPGATPLTTSDTITVTWSSTSGTKNCVAVGVPGVALTSPVDQNPAWFHAGTGTSPTVTTGTLAQAPEICIGIINNANLGLAPTLNNGFTQFAQQHTGTNAFTTLGYLNVSTTAAVTFSATIGSTTSCLNVVTLKLAAAAAAPPQAPYIPARRRPARAVVQFIPVTTVNAPAPAGTLQPRPTAQPPRRTPARAWWRQLASPGPAVVVQRHPLQVPRRTPSRALVRFVPVTTVNAAPSPPVGGTLQPLTARPAPRRTPARAVVQFVPVTTVNQLVPAGTLQPRATLTAPRRTPVRAWSRFTISPAPVPVAAGGQPLPPPDDKRLIRRKELRILGMRL